MEPGARVRCEMTKWRDRPHWTFSGTYLGSDRHGDWIGFPVGTSFTRPGAGFDAGLFTVTSGPKQTPR